MLCVWIEKSPESVACIDCGRSCRRIGEHLPQRRCPEAGITGPNDGSRCVHRGDPDGEVKCGCGGGRKLVAAFVCSMHGRCSDSEAKGVTWCRWCPDFS